MRKKNGMSSPEWMKPCPNVQMSQCSNVPNEGEGFHSPSLTSSWNGRRMHPPPVPRRGRVISRFHQDAPKSTGPGQEPGVGQSGWGTWLGVGQLQADSLGLAWGGGETRLGTNVGSAGYCSCSFSPNKWSFSLNPPALGSEILARPSCPVSASAQLPRGGIAPNVWTQHRQQRNWNRIKVLAKYGPQPAQSVVKVGRPL